MKFKKTLDVALLMFVAIVLCSTIGLKVIDKASHGVLEKQGIVPTAAQLEGRGLTRLGKASTERLLSGEFQDTLDAWISDRVPLRDNAVLVYAASQRLLIETANLPFGFDFYPTYYGSWALLFPEKSTLFWAASHVSEDDTHAAREFAGLVNDLALQHPEVDFAYDDMCSMDESEFNPSYAYRTNTFTRQWHEENIIDRLTAPNISAFYDPIESREEFLNLWFSTDHHWTLERALRSYNQIAGILDLETAVYEDPFLVTSTWRGSYCRRGRYLGYTSSLYDVPTDFSQLEWLTYDGEPPQAGEREAFLRGEMSFAENTTVNVYDKYFGRMNMQAVNHGENNGKKCLVIGVSFTKPLKRYIAANYQETLFIDPCNNSIDKALSEYLDEDFDVVIIQLRGASYAEMLEVSPEFVG